MQGLDNQREEAMKELNEKAAQQGFMIQPTPFGVAILPVRDGKQMTEAQMQSLSEEEREDITRRGKELQKELESVMKDVRNLNRSAREKLEELDKRIALNTVGMMVDDLVEEYRDLQQVVEYLDEVKRDVIENVETLKKSQQKQGQAAPMGLPIPQLQDGEASFKKYEVNVIVDNSKQEGPPVVVEMNPTYNHLLGRVEKEARFGALRTDFTMIRAGSLHRANGGFLVVYIEDVLRNLLSWDGLKRALRSGEIQIEDIGERLGYLATKSLRPQPIRLNAKVVLIGRPLWYYLLHTFDKDFPELFKIKADFDTRMDRDEKNIKEFFSFVCSFCNKEKLKHFDNSGAARLLEHASRMVSDQKKLSTHFGALVDVIREADFWAQRDNADTIGADHVTKAIDEKVKRSNLIEERIREMIERGTLLVDATGERVGQVNGLSVIDLHDYLFGKPTRITASVGPGRGGIVDIEREVELGGPIHSKGVLILGGYLVDKYAKDRPLSLSGKLVFEQSYEGVDGDSASSTELYAILSALAGLPLRQGVAVTGSVNQHGDIQAIGGVNQKIEGFFDVCKAKGLSGSQGVLIPQSNVQHLMVREDVVEAVKSGKFHIWAVKTVDEGIEILTGTPAGERRKDGRFPEGTVNGRVEQRLEEFSERVKEFRQSERGVPPSRKGRRKATKEERWP
jgi:lon-related putative ATP-dependent protease